VAKTSADDFSFDIFNTMIISEQTFDFNCVHDAKKTLNDVSDINGKWKEYLKYYIGNEEISQFVDKLWNTLNNPAIPMPKLKRDIYAFPTQTKFQAFLTEVFFNLEDENGLFIDPIIPSTLEAIASKDLDVNPDQFAKSKTTIFEMRWYQATSALPNTITRTASCIPKITSSKKIKKEKASPKLKPKFSPIFTNNISFKKLIRQKSLCLTNKTFVDPNPRFSSDSSDSDEEIISPKDTNNILGVYQLLNKSLKAHCRILSRYLKSIRNPANLLQEYCNKWEKFVSSILEMELEFKYLKIAISTLYERFYSDPFKNPQFAIWRLMAKIWIDEVYNELSEELDAAFRYTYLQNRIQSNTVLDLAQGTNTHQEVSINFHGKQVGEVMMKSLLPNVNEVSQSYVDCDLTEVLRRFLRSMQDLSVNELEVFIVESQLSNGKSPFNDLVKIVASDSALLYEEYKKLFINCPSYFKKFLQTDLEIVKEIGDKKSLLQVAKYQIITLNDFLRDSFTKRYEQSLSSVMEIEGVNSHTPARRIELEAVRDILFGEEFKVKFSNANNNAIFESIMITIGKDHETFFEDLAFLQQEAGEVDSIEEEENQYIRKLKSRGIYQELEPCLKVLVDLHKSVDFKVLDEINEYIKTQASTLTENFHQINFGQEITVV
jgi:hypothetical protein